MKKNYRVFVLLLVFILGPVFVNAQNEKKSVGQVGLATDKDGNFIISAPSQKEAEKVLEEAVKFRREIAIDWLGKELPSKEGPCIVYVRQLGDKDTGLTWPIDKPERTHHMVWITCPEKFKSNSLFHEITHAILNTKFPNHELLPWAEEGAAGMSDLPGRYCFDKRAEILGVYVKSNKWPNIQNTFDRLNALRGDPVAYAVSGSVTEYLVGLKSKKDFIEFAVYSKSDNLDTALKNFYGIKDVKELQLKWQSWLTNKLKGGKKN